MCDPCLLLSDAFGRQARPCRRLESESQAHKNSGFWECPRRSKAFPMRSIRHDTPAHLVRTHLIRTARDQLSSGSLQSMSQPTLHGPWLLEALSPSFPRSCGEFLEKLNRLRYFQNWGWPLRNPHGPKAVFLFSVLAFPEYSLLEPPRAKSELFVLICSRAGDTPYHVLPRFRKAGLLQRPEL